MRVLVASHILEADAGLQIGKVSLETIIALLDREDKQKKCILIEK